MSLLAQFRPRVVARIHATNPSVCTSGGIGASFGWATPRTRATRNEWVTNSRSCATSFSGSMLAVRSMSSHRSRLVRVSVRLAPPSSG